MSLERSERELFKKFLAAAGTNRKWHFLLRREHFMHRMRSVHRHSDEINPRWLIEQDLVAVHDCTDLATGYVNHGNEFPCG